MSRVMTHTFRFTEEDANNMAEAVCDDKWMLTNRDIDLGIIKDEALLSACRKHATDMILEFLQEVTFYVDVKGEAIVEAAIIGDYFGGGVKASEYENDVFCDDQ